MGGVAPGRTATQQQFNILCSNHNLMYTRGDDVETEEMIELNVDSERVAMGTTAGKWLMAMQSMALHITVSVHNTPHTQK